MGEKFVGSQDEQLLALVAINPETPALGAFAYLEDAEVYELDATVLNNKIDGTIVNGIFEVDLGIYGDIQQVLEVARMTWGPTGGTRNGTKTTLVSLGSIPGGHRIRFRAEVEPGGMSAQVFADIHETRSGLG